MKQLTGKAKDDFFKWLLKNRKLDGMNYHYSYLIQFDRIPQSAKFGLIQEWGDSVGEKISIYWREIDDDWFVYIGIVMVSESFFKSRPEAEREAVKKLSEIYNK